MWIRSFINRDRDSTLYLVINSTDFFPRLAYPLGEENSSSTGIDLTMESGVVCRSTALFEGLLKEMAKQVMYNHLACK